MKKTDKENYVPDYEALFEENGKKSKAGSSILKKLYKNNFFSIVLSVILFIVKNCPVWAIPIATAAVINNATYQEPDSLRKMLISGAILLVLVLQNIPTHVIYSKYTDKMLRTIGAGLRNTLVRKLQHLSLTYHKSFESGKIQSKFIRDIEAIEALNTSIMKSLIPCIISVIISITISASKSGTVTIFFLLVIPLNVLLITKFRGKMKTYNKYFRKETEDISAKMNTMLEMIPVTKAHGLEDEEISMLEHNIKKLKEKGLLLDRTNAYFGSYTWVLSQALSAFCLVFCGYLALKGKIAVGDIVIYQTYFTSISSEIQALVNIYPQITKGIESIQSVSEVVLSDEIEDNSDKIRLRYVHGTVEFDNVSYHFPHESEDVIKDFSLKVEPGECIAFVGSSGSGKSTIMNMIIGFLNATKGEVKIDGKPIEYLNLTDYRKFISVVPQNSILFTGTIRENITYGLHEVDENKLNEVVKLANIEEFLKDMPKGLDTFIGEHGGKLSGGQKQRISIARALIRDPRILILDEATSALDNISEYHVQKAIDHLIKGRTTFIVAHRLSTIRGADRICVMDEGRCVEMGTYEELMALKGRFYELKNLSEMNYKEETDA